MSVAPSPETVYDRSEDEGGPRLSMPLLAQVATGFTAGEEVLHDRRPAC